VEEFKKLLSAEVGKAMKELGELRAERKALEHQISDLFALKAKHGGDVSGASETGKDQYADGAVEKGFGGRGYGSWWWCRSHLASTRRCTGCQ
jgi:hypothetical protein